MYHYDPIDLNVVVEDVGIESEGEGIESEYDTGSSVDNIGSDESDNDDSSNGDDTEDDKQDNICEDINRHLSFLDMPTRSGRVVRINQRFS